MELRRHGPWDQADRIPLSVVVGNRAQSWAPAGADHLEPLALRDLASSAIVVVAGDDHPHLIPLIRALRAIGREVLHVADAGACERLVQDSPRGVVALVCCAEMKEISGFELARRVIQSHADVRVLLILGDGSDSRERDRASSFGYAHILGSANPREICSRLADLIGVPGASLGWLPESCRSQ
jgi:hypothetical protein